MTREPVSPADAYAVACEDVGTDLATAIIGAYSEARAKSLALRCPPGSPKVCWAFDVDLLPIVYRLGVSQGDVERAVWRIHDIEVIVRLGEYKRHHRSRPIKTRISGPYMAVTGTRAVFSSDGHRLEEFVAVCVHWE